MIGLRIRSLREKKKYSLSELAKKSGISKSYLSQIERNLQSNPSLQLLSKLAISLGTTVEELLGMNEQTDSNNEQLDYDWTVLVKEAIDEGMSKEEFKELSNFIRFKNQKQNNPKNT
jgi:XRE family transcriptional regulator, master regulator for biofilm formation